MENQAFHSNLENNIALIKVLIKKNLQDKGSVGQLMTGLPAEEGKLIRATFVMLGGSYGNIDNVRLINIAAAVELLHLATLVHDDIVDDADIRRGSVAINKLFSTKSALFAGDYLFSQSYILFSNSCEPKSIIAVSKTIKSICRAEIQQYFSLQNINGTLKEYLRRINGKCACLFSLSLSIGALEGNADKKIIRDLKYIGYYVGMAFQLMDDILDFTSCESKLGKPAGNDIKQGIYTLPIIYELESNTQLKKLLQEKNTQAVMELMKKSNGLKRAERLAEKYTYKARNLIAGLPNSYEKIYLREITEKLLTRKF